MTTLLTKKDIEEFIYSFIHPHFIHIEEKEHTALIYIYFEPKEYGNIHAESLEHLLFSELRDRLPVTSGLKLKVRKFEQMNPHEVWVLKESLKFDVVKAMLTDLKETQVKINKRNLRIKRRQFYLIIILIILEVLLLFKIYGRNNINEKIEQKEDQKIELFTQYIGISVEK